MEVIFIYHCLFIFWNIGRIVWENRFKYLNPIEKYSLFFSYQYGDSYHFKRNDIRLMRRFYLDFPIYYHSLNKISWEQFKEILVLNDKDERYFYYYLSLFFNSDLQETKEFISNEYYVRI